MPEIDLPEDVEAAIARSPKKPGPVAETDPDKLRERLERRRAFRRDYMKAYQKVPRVKLMRRRRDLLARSKRVDEALAGKDAGATTTTCQNCGQSFPKHVFIVRKVDNENRVLCRNCDALRRWEETLKESRDDLVETVREFVAGVEKKAEKGDDKVKKEDVQRALGTRVTTTTTDVTGHTMGVSTCTVTNTATSR